MAPSCAASLDRARARAHRSNILSRSWASSTPNHPHSRLGKWQSCGRTRPTRPCPVAGARTSSPSYSTLVRSPCSCRTVS
eukprot:scaffold16146_cov65-Phaeocystis_antarctica.AAC.2